MNVSWLILVTWIFLSCLGQAENTEYSNVQDGVWMRVLNYDSENPTLRIENGGRNTLAIHNDTSLAVSFWQDGKQIKATRNEGILMALNNGLRTRNSDQIAIIGTGASLEIPLREISFNIYEPGYGVKVPWHGGLSLLTPGKYKVRFTSNGLGITVLDVNFTPFSHNFDIPEFEMQIGK